MVGFRISTFIITCLLVVTSHGGNYDGYLADMAVRNAEARDLFRQFHPNGGPVLDYLSSHDFLQDHPLLRDEESDEQDEGLNEHWLRLLESLMYAEEAAKEQSSAENIGQRLRLSAPWTQNLSSRAAKREPSMMARSIEVAPQNDLWGEHRMSGGSSEVGKWMEYAIYSAHAQEDVEDDEDESLKGLSSGLSTSEVTFTSPPLESEEEEEEEDQASKQSGVKVDKLPAYCDPPNPCPLGYDIESLPSPCDQDIPNTKNFNRAWIFKKMHSGECSCDEEHMESCPSTPSSSANSPRMGVRSIADVNNGFSYLPSFHLPQAEGELMDLYASSNPYMRGQKRGSLEAKKWNHMNKRGALIAKPLRRPNPYFNGERLHSVVKKAGPPLDDNYSA